MKKVGKITRPFRYDLNQILYDYTVEVRNRFKGLDLKHRVPEELWTQVPGIVQEAGVKTSPKKKTGDSKHGLPTTQEKALHMDITRWPTTKPD